MECIFITSLIECIFTKPTPIQTQPLLTPSHISPPPPPPSQIKPQTPHMAEKPLPFLTTTAASWDGDEEWDLVTFVAAAARAAAD